MRLSDRAKELVAELGKGDLRLGEIKRRGKEIGKDHDLAMELWSTGERAPRLLAVLTFDPKLLGETVIERLAAELLTDAGAERDAIADWMLANQLMKDRKLAALIPTWERHGSSILRRWFWYHQARLRWTGQTPPGNSAALLASLESDMATEAPEVQWAMNFCACQIGLHEPAHRARCIGLGETLGLYRGERVPKNCTPSYIPEFIRIELAKRR
ncbi:MAG TPA: DNA alkylation repair protein [Phycisphaerales bacterium]|nr:DNA alkylation repair protein [Phycisphaerales bacterium]HMP38505.1 DNA alkylation repair protein [Phycisphaerales bacterium]